jgi:hypothetical protein
MELEVFAESIVESIDKRVRNVISRRAFTDYSEMCRSNVHSWLEWAVIDAGQRLGLVCVPEFKLRLPNPLDPSEFGISDRRRKHQVKVDVAVFGEFSKFLGFVECITFDVAHECFSTRDVNFKWLTFRDRLPFTIKNLEEKPEFVILLLILPKSIERVPWKTGKEEIDAILQRKNYFDDLGSKWRELVESIKEFVDAKLILINENETLVY